MMTMEKIKLLGLIRQLPKEKQLEVYYMTVGAKMLIAYSKMTV